MAANQCERPQGVSPERERSEAQGYLLWSGMGPVAQLVFKTGAVV
jgi:hypothetical protein